MKMCCVPKCFTELAEHSLSDHTTCLQFNNYLSDPISLNNKTTQDYPSSMFYYSFYNAPLIDTAQLADVLSPGFVNDYMMLVMGPTLAACHAKLKDMMECPNGEFEWS
jgi:hypothetical protein